MADEHENTADCWVVGYRVKDLPSIEMRQRLWDLVSDHQDIISSDLDAETGRKVDLDVVSLSETCAEGDCENNPLSRVRQLQARVTELQEDLKAVVSHYEKTSDKMPRLQEALESRNNQIVAAKEALGFEWDDPMMVDVLARLVKEQRDQEKAKADHYSGVALENSLALDKVESDLADMQQQRNEAYAARLDSELAMHADLRRYPRPTHYAMMRISGDLAPRGAGAPPGGEGVICDACDGTGRSPGAAQTQSGPGVTMTCSKCGDTGRLVNDHQDVGPVDALEGMLVAVCGHLPGTRVLIYGFDPVTGLDAPNDFEERHMEED